MTLPDTLRAIATRIENADDARRAALADLRALLDGSRIEGDSASVPEADERQPGEGVRNSASSPAAPLEEPGLSPMLACPECGHGSPEKIAGCPCCESA